MKAGETLNIVQKLNLTKPYDVVRFRLSNGINTITKDLTEDSGGVFVIPLYQEDTHKLEGRVSIEAEVDFEDKSVRYSNFNDIYLNKTLGYDPVENNQPSDDDGVDLIMESIEQGVAVVISPESAEELISLVTELFQDTKDIAQSVRDDADNGEFDGQDGQDGYSPQVTVKTETPSTYVLHIKDADHEFDTPNLQGQGGEGTLEAGDGLKREGNVVSVDRLDTDNNALVFSSGKLNVSRSALARNSGFRMDLTSTDYANALVSKTYVDSLVSTSLKRLVVQTLPQNPNTYTIYMILRSAPTTNNIYDEYMYINNAWELIGSTEVDLSNYYTKTESNQTFEKQLATENGITITRTSASSTIGLTISSYLNGNKYLKFNANPYGLYLDFTTMYTDGLIVSKSTFDNGMLAKQDKLTAGTNITIDSNNVISASGGGLYTFTDGLTESSGTVGIDLASGSKLLIDSNDKLDIDLSDYATQTDLSSKQDTIDSNNKLDADLVDDTNSSNKFVSASEKQGWNAKADTSDIPTNVSELTNDSGYQTSSDVASAIANKEDKTTISTDTTSTTVSLTLADNHEYRYTTDLTSLTLTMPSGDFIASVVFSSGSTPTSMTYDSSIKWSGDDVTSNAFVPQASKDYDIMFYYNGLNINGIVRSAS